MRVTRVIKKKMSIFSLRVRYDCVYESRQNYPSCRRRRAIQGVFRLFFPTVLRKFRENIVEKRRYRKRFSITPSS